MSTPRVLRLALALAVVFCLATPPCFLAAQDGFISEAEFFGDASAQASPQASASAKPTIPPQSSQPPAPRAAPSPQASPKAPPTASPSPAADSFNDRSGWDSAALDTAAGAAYLSPLEREIILELNMVRTNPAAYTAIAQAWLGYYQGNLIRIPGETAIRTNEGTAAVRELVRYLQTARPMPPLTPSTGLSRAARDHAADQGRTGATGHTGADGSSMSRRVERYGRWDRTIGENIDYGWDRARLIVLSLMVDDGVASRGHRTNIMNKDFRRIGVACGPHPVYGELYVMDFAGGYSD
jgi:uncharacterized protein YkwD